MQTTLRKWGNSIGVQIPAAVLSELDLSENSTVELRVEDGRLIVAPQRKRKWKYSLDQLLAGVTETNIHPETDWGILVGDEAW